MFLDGYEKHLILSAVNESLKIGYWLKRHSKVYNMFCWSFHNSQCKNFLIPVFHTHINCNWLMGSSLFICWSSFSTRRCRLTNASSICTSAYSPLLPSLRGIPILLFYANCHCCFCYLTYSNFLLFSSLNSQQLEIGLDLSISMMSQGRWWSTSPLA